MRPEAGKKTPPRQGTGSPGHGDRLTDVAKRYARGVVEQLRIWHERTSLERELSKLDDASLSDLGLTRAQIPTFVGAYPIAGELLDLMLARLDLAGDTASMLRSTYEDLLRTCSMCKEHRQCKRWLASGERDEGYKDFCPNSWVLDQLRRSRP